MFGPRAPTILALALLTASVVSCGGTKSPASPGAGGTTGGSSGLAGGAGAAGTGGTAGTSSYDGGDAPTAGDGGGADLGTDADPCPKMLAPVRPSGTVLELPFEVVFAGQPFVYGEANAVAPGRTVTPLNFRFYVTQVRLLAAGGGSVPVDIVTAAGAQQPYGVFLFNADSADAQTLRVLAPPGSYAGVTFAVGLPPGCNSGRDGAGRSSPLSADSQMTWPHSIGYLFLRYESRISATVGPDAGVADAGVGPPLPAMIHMGGDLMDLSKPSALAVRLDGSLSIPATGSARKVVRVAMDQIFKGATAEIDLSDFIFATSPEIAAGERLRRSGAGLPLFTFGP